MARSVLALDVGGAHLKAAHSGGGVRLQPFELWKNPSGLAAALNGLLQTLPTFDLLAVTMTGELCDCFESKRQGVSVILDAVAAVAGHTPVQVWCNDGRLVDTAEARAIPLQVAAANWLALATFAGRYAPTGPGLLLDVGSTTTDIVPLMDGRPVPSGRTDPQRLRASELVYTGVRRTPLCAILGDEAAAELFATTLDVYLVFDVLPEDAADCRTADGRPATRAAAHARLARMLCADLETCSEEERKDLCLKVLNKQKHTIGTAVARVANHLAALPQAVIVAGSGEWLGRAALRGIPALAPAWEVRLAVELGPEVSHAACAHALAVLAAEEQQDGR